MNIDALVFNSNGNSAEGFRYRTLAGIAQRNADRLDNILDRIDQRAKMGYFHLDLNDLQEEKFVLQEMGFKIYENPHVICWDRS